MRYHEKFICHWQNVMGLSYPIHFLKSRGSVIRNNFLEYRTKQATLLRDEMIFMHCLLQKSKTYTH